MTIRTNGILMHISSLPGRYGIGDLGPAAYGFADFLSATGQQIWQVLPLNPVDPQSGSPYSSPSAFAGNPLLISLHSLIRAGLLSVDETLLQQPFSDNRVDYPAVAEYKHTLFQLAFERLEQQGKTLAGFDRFCARQKAWLEDYAVYMALKAHFNQAGWQHWPEPLRDRHPDALEEMQNTLALQIRFHKFVQFLFFRQWQAIKDYCNQRSIHLYGDLPIYMPFDSADVWSCPQQYKLDENKSPLAVSGVPPDYFSDTGQLWGHPVYDWQYLQKTGYTWWINRFAHNFDLFDLVRIDHFRGLVAYWEVAASAETAVDGQWVQVPGDDFFTRLTMRFERLPVIAEDLGTITPDVRECMEKFQLPGMRVLQFAFGEDFPHGSFLPHHHIRNCVVYTGTHDNNTLRGWFEEELTTQAKARLQRYVGTLISAENIHRQMMRLAMMSVADTVIIPLQDILGLDSDARLNTPGNTQDNWQWRLPGKKLTKQHAAWLKKTTAAYGRCRVSPD
ncbi:MAG: 4-alpha-glucanotransferase [Thermodesulfobacteriota bacterium]|nr:4-alpha-glucanotransferase [Thermodesulfobacteriota bacterium]